MREEIKNYKEIIENYYKMQYGKDVVFDFMHIVIKYTYIYLQKPINVLHKEGGITVRYEDTRENVKETLFVPFIVDPKYYEEKFSDDLYYIKRTLRANGVVDIGSSYNFNYSGIYKKIDEVMPKECTVISESELKKIAEKQGYDKFEWEIDDRAAGLPPIAYSGPNWICNFYGVREKVQEFPNDIKKDKR